MTEEKDVYRELPSEDDDVLLEQLGRLVRQEEAEEQRRFGDRLRRLREGPPGDDEPSEQERLDAEALRPLDDSFKRRALARLKAELRSVHRTDGHRTDGHGADDHSADERAVDVHGAGRDEPQDDDTERALPFPSRRRRSPPPPLLALAAALALAAVALWLLPGVFGPAQTAFDLPDYVLELEGGRSEQRGAAAGPAAAMPELALGDTFRLLLRPERDVAGELDFELYLAGAGGELRPWPGEAELASESGAVRLEVVLGRELDIEPGLYTFVFLYGAGSLPEPATLDELQSLDEQPSWRYQTLSFRVVLPPLAAGDLPLDVLYAGCFELTVAAGGAVCVPHRSLAVWARTEPGVAITVQLDGEPVAGEGSPVDGGRRFAVPMEVQDGELQSRRLLVRAERGAARSTFELALRPPEDPAWLLESRRQAVAGEPERARRRLLEYRDSARALSLLARLPPPPPGSGERDADAWQERRVELLESAVRRHRDAGRWSAMAEDIGMLASFDVAGRRFVSLRGRLEDLLALRRQLPAEALFHLAYYRGILANDLGNARGALAALDEAEAVARRLDLRQQLIRARGEKALLLQRLGRGREASALFASVDPAAIRSPCERAQWHNNHGWSLLLAAGELGDASAPLEQAAELAERHGCEASLRLNVHLNRALAHVLAGRSFEAEQELQASGALASAASPLHELWRLDIEARLLVAAGRHGDALELYRQLEEKAEAAIEPRARWHARVQRAEAFEALGQVDSALAELEAADAAVAAEGLEVPLGAGRGNFLADRELGVRRRLDLLLRQGRAGEAFDVARRSRNRALQALRRGHRLAHLSAGEQVAWDRQIGRYLALRADIESEAAGAWRLSQTALRDAEHRLAEERRRALAALDDALRVFAWSPAELPPLRDGETVLLFHPLDGDWAAFAAGPGGVESHRFELQAGELGDPRRLSRLLLEPFRPLLESSRRLRLLPHGELQSVDFHALPWGGGVLLDQAPVVYGLDLHREGELEGRDGALIVSDPRGDLPAARAEAAAVEAALGSGSGPVTVLEGAEATLPEVLLRLPGAAHFHVAGHGETAGAFAWQSALLLAGEGRLGVGDVLTLEPAPAVVVLSSCESASDAGEQGIGLGLAQAFLVAGSRQVIATTRPVGDTESAALFRHFYDTVAREATGGDMAEPFRQAQLAWRDADPRADWSSYRLLVP